MKTLRELVPAIHTLICRASPRSFKAGGLVWAALLAALLAVGVTPARAGVSTNVDFELDGNAVNSGAAGDDWDNVLGCSGGTCGSTATGGDTIHVGPIAEPHLRFTQGTKDEERIDQWRWDLHGTPDKSTITDIYAARYSNNILYFGADRLANNGDAQLGFWFFRNAVSPNADGTFSGSHAVGDLLVLVNFLKGGSVNNIQVFKWVGENNGNNDDTTVPAPGAGNSSVQLLVSQSNTTLLVCDPLDIACAITNGGSVVAPWPYTPKSGPSGFFPKLSFFEGGVDLNALNLGNECFASFAGETRSSQSITAELKDIILHAFQPCNAAISVTKQCTAAVVPGGTSVNVTFNGQVCNTGTDDLGSVLLTDDKGGVTTPPSGTLAIGACSNYSGSYTSPSLVNSDTVTASATGVNSHTNVSAQASAGCTAVASPSCSVNKNCATHLVLDNSKLTVQVNFDGQVCNTGNVALSNVALSNDQLGVTSPPPSTLAVGACEPYSGSYFPTSLGGSSGTASDTVTVTADGALNSGSKSCTATQSCNLCPLQ